MSSQTPMATQQIELPGVSSTSEVFKRLYFHLYSNSGTTRAEKIYEDLALLLLIKLAAETLEAPGLERFRHGNATANGALVPLLRDTYPDLVDEHQRFALGDEAVRVALDELDSITLTTAPAHVIGEAFQALIGPRLRGDRGQFFTPRSLVKAMVSIVNPLPHESVLDPACGTGGFLMEAHIHQSRDGSATGALSGVDKDEGLSRLAAALLAVATRGRARIQSFDSLDRRKWPESDDGPYDVVLTNPPFGARIGVKALDVLRALDFGHQWVASEADGRWVRTTATLSSQDPQILFIETCVRQLKPGGRLGIVLPEGVFGNRGTAYVWDWVRERGEIFALMDCPRTTFQPSTDTKTNVLFFRKAPANSRSKRREKFQVGVALHSGHDRRGRVTRSDGSPYPDDFTALAEDFNRTRREIWKTVIPGNPYYLVPRYHIEEGPTSQQEAGLIDGAAMRSLQDLMDEGVLQVRKGHEVGSEAYGTGTIPFVRTSDIANLEIRVDPTNSVSEETYTLFAPQQQLGAGDVLLVVDGRYRIGTSAILTDNNARCVVQSHIRILSVSHEAALTPYALLFALNLPSVKLRLRDLVFVQSTLGTLGKRLFELRIPLLVGLGPWSDSVHRFERTLRQRDRLLSELRNLAGAEVEL